MENSTSNKEPLLLNREEEEGDEVKQLPSTASSFVAEGDIEPIRGLGGFTKEFWVESKKLWYLAGPAIFTSICQYSLGAITQTFAGHVGTLQLAAVSVENSVIAGFSFGVMVSYISPHQSLSIFPSLISIFHVFSNSHRLLKVVLGLGSPPLH